MITNEFGELSNLFTNSKVDYIVSYATAIEKLGFGESGTDTDGDGVPDSLDSDDDGDGIEDNWDLNCVNVGIACELLPDENYIRSIDLILNSTHLIVDQSFTLNKQHSASIRDLSRFSLDTDIKLSQDETQLFADSICLNMEQDVIASSIASFISIQNTSISLDEFDCKVTEGMVLMPANDRTSHIRYSIQLTYRFDAPQNLDQLTIQLDNHRLPANGSITELSEQHPIFVTLSGEGINSEQYVPWHIQEESVQFSLTIVETDDQEIDATSLLSSPIVLVVLLLGIGATVLGGIFLLRKQSSKSSYQITLDDEEFDDEDDDEYIEDSFFDELEEFEEPEQTEQPTEKKVASKRVAVRRRSVNDAEKLLQESSEEVVRKRKAKQSTQEPVRTKRRKLSDSEPTSEPRKRRAVKKPQSEDDFS